MTRSSSSGCVINTVEWKAAYMRHDHKAPPEVPPTLDKLIQWVAALGGHEMRSKSFLCAQALWLGLQRVNKRIFAWNLFAPANTADIPAF
jgi:hypothetical protein